MTNFWTTLNRPILALAPMVGITDSAYRRLAKLWGADVVYSEMIAAEALIRKIPKSEAMLRFQPEEQPLVMQIMGNNPKTISQAAKICEAAGASGLDLNFGCPAHKIARNFCGVMLMRDLDLCRHIIEAALNAVQIPVSIKVRISINCSSNPLPGKPKKINTVIDLLNKISDLPISAIMVHGRSFEASYHGAIDLETIKRVKKIFTRGPVLANGGLTTVESAKTILETTGADGLGLARSTLGQPWIFKQIKDYLTTGHYDEIAWSERKKIMQQYTDWFYELYGPKYFESIRRHLAHYVKGQSNAGELRQQLVKVNSPADVAKILTQI